MKRFGGLVLLAVSLMVLLVVGEFLVRAVLDKVDYLEPTLSPHPVLGHVIAPYAGGHDAWGFRNAAVPARAEIVAIGDSLTYGYSASADQSWPAWLGRIAGKGVYNLALGGYAPPDYEYLFENYVDRLSPETVVVGFYLGNDLSGAYRFAVGERKSVADMTAGDEDRFLGGPRGWLARNSVLYQAAKLQAVSLIGTIRAREEGLRGKKGFFLLEHPTAGTSFYPGEKLSALDQGEADNRLGLSTSLDLFRQIEQGCAARGIACLYVLLPTKESVLWPLAEGRMDPAGYEILTRVAQEEDRVRRAAIQFFESQGLAFVDPLTALRAAAGERRIYRPDSDEHPIGAGYRVIAAEIAKLLKTRAPGGGSD